jgi:hypothetical protein
MKMTDIIMSRTCQVITEANSAAADLVIRFSRPVESENAPFEASAEVICPYFNRDIRVFGSDSVQALAGLMHAVLAYLEGRAIHGGYTIYFHEPGDLNFTDFWRYQR